MNILVTNDDGVHAPGLLTLAQSMRELGEVTVLAPDRNWSMSGHKKTMERPLHVHEARLADDTAAYACDGSPSDCVALVMLGLFEKKFDLVVSGINPNANVGQDITYSGTVSAAIEAVLSGVPGMAVSLDSPSGLKELDYGPTARTALRVARKLVRNPLPEGVVLSVNVPYLPDDELRGFQITRQGKRIYRDALVHYTAPGGRPFYWIGGDHPTGTPEDGTDIGALAAGYVSLTPLHLDLTAHPVVESLNGMEW
jgi:5'-nucleotidase